MVETQVGEQLDPFDRLTAGSGYINRRRRSAEEVLRARRADLDAVRALTRSLSAAAAPRNEHRDTLRR